jgi:hypothetical protein
MGMVWICFALGKKLAVDFCEHDDDNFDSMKDGKFLGNRVTPSFWRRILLHAVN